jgi:Na+-transporting methylmalonyl-CoA/oxaloacetate decarboxylase gamma subunit
VNAPWPHGDPRDVVHRVLADARFARAAQRPGEKSWFDYVVDALRELWHRLLAPLRGLTGNSTLTTVIGIAVLVAVLALLALVVVRFARGVAWRRAPRARLPSAVPDADADARTLFERALAAAAAGRHHDAAALLWASALRALDERGRVRFDPARTPGEWRRAVRDPSFDALARDAVVALFGDRGADAALVARMREAYDRVAVLA